MRSYRVTGISLSEDTDASFSFSEECFRFSLHGDDRVPQLLPLSATVVGELPRTQSVEKEEDVDAEFPVKELVFSDDDNDSEHNASPRRRSQQAKLIPPRSARTVSEGHAGSTAPSPTELSTPVSSLDWLDGRVLIGFSDGLLASCSLPRCSLCASAPAFSSPKPPDLSERLELQTIAQVPRYTRPLVVTNVTLCHT